MADSDHTPQRRSPKSKVCYTRSLKVRKGTYARVIKDKYHSHFDRVCHRALDQYPRAVVGTGRVYHPDADHRPGYGRVFGVDRGGA